MMPSILIIFFGFVTLAFGAMELPPELKAYADALHDLCVKRTGITEDDHAAYDIMNNPHDEKLQCYMKCLFMEAKWMTKDGVIEYDWIEDTIHDSVRDIVVPALKQCRNIEEGANLCEKASHFNACMYKADNGENWFLV